MSTGSKDLFEALSRFAGEVSKAAAREMPAARAAASRIVRDDVPTWQRTAERVVRSVAGDLRRRTGR